MSKVAVVYWSGTGNTEMMAQKVAEGAKEAGAEVSVLTCADFSADDVDAYDAIAFKSFFLYFLIPGDFSFPDPTALFMVCRILC